MFKHFTGKSSRISLRFFILTGDGILKYYKSFEKKECKGTIDVRKDVDRVHIVEKKKDKDKAF